MNPIGPIVNFVLGILSVLYRWNEDQLAALRRLPWGQMIGWPLAVIATGAFFFGWGTAWRARIVILGVIYLWASIIYFLVQNGHRLVAIALETPIAGSILRSFGLLDELTGVNEAGAARGVPSTLELANKFLRKVVVGVAMSVTALALTALVVPFWEYPEWSSAITLGAALLWMYCFHYESPPIYWRRFALGVAIVYMSLGAVGIFLSAVGPANTDIQRFLGTFGLAPGLDTPFYGHWWRENMRVLVTMFVVFASVALGFPALWRFLCEKVWRTRAAGSAPTASPSATIPAAAGMVVAAAPAPAKKTSRHWVGAVVIIALAAWLVLGLGGTLPFSLLWFVVACVAGFLAIMLFSGPNGKETAWLYGVAMTLGLVGIYVFKLAGSM